MPTEARPAFLAITGRIEPEIVEATQRFAASLQDAGGDSAAHPAVIAASALAARAFAGDRGAWGPLVDAVRDLLAASPAVVGRGRQSRRALLAFIEENADLIEG